MGQLCDRNLDKIESLNLADNQGTLHARALFYEKNYFLEKFF